MLYGLSQENQDEIEGSEGLLIVELPSDQAGKTRNEISISSLIDSTEPVAMEIRDSGVEKPMSPRQL